MPQFYEQIVDALEKGESFALGIISGIKGSSPQRERVAQFQGFRSLLKGVWPTASACRAVADRRRLVVREGSDFPISGCRPDVILFHHRAVEARLVKIGCRGWARTNMAAFKGRVLLIRRPGRKKG